MNNRYDVPDKTLQDKVRFIHAHDAAKHDLAKRGDTPEDYADDKINQMSQSEFLKALSDGLEELLKEKDDEL